MGSASQHTQRDQLQLLLSALQTGGTAKEENLHEIVELRAQSVLYKVEFVKNFEKQIEDEEELIEFQQMSSSASGTCENSPSRRLSRASGVSADPKLVRISYADPDDLPTSIPSANSSSNNQTRVQSIEQSID